LFPLDGSEVPVDFCGDGGTGAGPAECTGTPPDQHNDDDSATVPLPFTFDLYGTLFDSVFVNNNGNLSFGNFFSTFTASGLPVSGFPIVAPFWGDVDTGNPSNQIGDVVMRFMDGDTSGGDETLIVTWNNVGYFNEHGDLLNTFQVAISDGTNPLMGIGNNVCFSYQSMQWTTGDASGGSGGFGGTPATVGVNAGNGTDFFQIGRFDHLGTDYDGPGGNADGIQYLDGQQICLNTSTQDFNIAPIASNFPPGNQVTILPATGGVLSQEVLFLSPESGQSTDVAYVVSTADGTPGAPGLTVTVTPGNVATVQLDWAPTCDDAGTYDIAFTATDDFDPPGVTDVTLQVIVAPCGTGDCNSNGIPDECELTGNDCNDNGIPDDCDGGCGG